MFIILENDNNRWRQVPGTSVYESEEEAKDAGEELELFDSIIVKFIRFI